METNGTTRIESFVVSHGPPDIPAKAKLKDDRLNIFVLLVLYSIQAIPYGISLAIPIIIQNMHHSSFNEQAQFSLALWPYSMKLLWAPFVDSLFIRKLGRRKSWLIPVQYLLGIFFFATGFHINDWLVYASKPQINVLTTMFFVLNFLAATQDIAVDGWAITMLKRENISYASICNCAGQTIGEILGYVLLIVLISESFCNKWLRISPLPGGLITLQGYLYFWGVVYIVVTTLVAIFKSDKDYISENGSVNMSMIETYKLLFRIMKLPNIKKLLIIIFTVGISFSVIDAAFKLKLMDGGVTKNEIATIEFLIIILQLSIPFLFIKFSSEGKPMTLFLRTVIYRLVIDVVIIITIYFTPFFVVQKGNLFVMYKLTLVLIFILYQSMVFIVMLSTTAFYASISDPQIGGTYMTLLNTVANLGSIGSRTGALWLIDFLTYKRCSVDHTNTCYDKNETNVCNSSGGTCQTFIDGFYTEALICTFYGMIWCWVFRKAIVNLQSINIGEWHVEVKKKLNVLTG